MNPAYHEAERDIIAWLLTQVPGPVCSQLAAKICLGDHRGFREREPQPEKQWEIPVTFIDEVSALHLEVMKGELFADGLQLCRTDDGRLVIVPFRPLLPLQLERIVEFLRSYPGIASIGEPIPFDVAHIRAPW